MLISKSTLPSTPCEFQTQNEMLFASPLKNNPPLHTNLKYQIFAPKKWIVVFLDENWAFGIVCKVATIVFGMFSKSLL